ncbi:helicase-related protein [Lignipirellula cremea]|uniref:RNA polymerase-associated protein RapA n=1 Tax=Lignipirellula cremea TaxID=2528010 RepID=A0A518DWN7_9BACT|nr:helicase-related protein [Lignipirellula cremea]QDU96255.1 RNA polymerase-associated protein RapA [Lignipirellula cremea]
MSFSVGSLVRARGREWVVLPESQPDFLVVRPLGGTDAEVAGIDTTLESVDPASFALPDPNRLGDFQSCRMLRDAIRLGFRSSAGPFRSFGKIAVEPRPYQLVPLLMALKLDPVRLLIADDVGIGKTVEALLIARELLDRAEVQRLSVLCPPHLAEQWRDELRDKFHIEAELVLSSTARRLDRVCGNRSVFDVFPYTIVSLDYIKGEARRDDFIRACPEFVIVDEAHTCTASGQPGRGSTRQQRHEVVKALSQNPDRHLLLVTATPHSGNEEGFRSLLGLLDDDFANLPADLSGDQNRRQRERLAKFFVQRRRGDIRHYLESDTAFPDRLEQEQTYKLGASDYHKLFDRLLSYAREVVQESEGMSRVRQRVRWWAALALLRALASSPAAAAATLRSKLQAISAESPDEVDEISRPLVFDDDSDDSSDTPDVVAGADIADLADDESEAARERKRLLDMARAADKLQGDGDPKLAGIVPIVKKLVAEGSRPILFCRFIATAEYLADQLRQRLPKGVTVIAVTGQIPPSEREQRIQELRDLDKYVLVCTDCLSEGINLQHLFDSVIHYDLSWNPTRHEQREGRVDRFGQPKPEVKVLTWYGVDNQIDGVVLEVLIRKHKAIRKALGVSIPVPTTSNAVLEALYEGLLLRRKDSQQQLLPFSDDDEFQPMTTEFNNEWQNAADREKKSRSLFAQHTIKPDEVAQEVAQIQAAIGGATDVESFVTSSVKAYRGVVSQKQGRSAFDLTESPRSVRESLGNNLKFEARFELPVSDHELYLSRTHPITEGLAAYVMDSALDASTAGDGPVPAARCGVIRTKAVSTRTTLLLIRLRYHIITTHGDEVSPLLAEDTQLVGFRSAPASAQWLTREEAESLLLAQPDDNVTDDVARNFIQKVIDDFDHLKSHLNATAEAHGKELLAAHQRVRTAANRRGIKYSIEPQLPPDVLGLYVYLP